MRRRAHYTLPDLIIESAEGTIEDERSRLWVSRKMVGEIQGIAEHLDTLARRLLREPASFSHEAIASYTENLGAMLEALDDRLAASLHVIDTVLDNWNGKQPVAATAAETGV